MIKRVKEKEEKYKDAEITIWNYNILHIYLTKEEIEDFNEKSDEFNLDIQLVPLH